MANVQRLILSTDAAERDLVVDAFKEYVFSLRDDRCPSSWQEAWNNFRDGRLYVRVTPYRCHECRGRGTSRRSVSRGSNVCLSCRGTRRGQPLVVQVAAAVAQG